MHYVWLQSIAAFLNTLRFANTLLISIPRQAWAPQGLMIQVKLDRKQLYVSLSGLIENNFMFSCQDKYKTTLCLSLHKMSYKSHDIYSLQHVNICPLQSLFTPAQPRVIISEKVGAEIRLFPASMGHQVWPKNPFLADGRILLSAQGLGQQARTLVLLLLY